VRPSVDKERSSQCKCTKQGHCRYTDDCSHESPSIRCDAALLRTKEKMFGADIRTARFTNVFLLWLIRQSLARSVGYVDSSDVNRVDAREHD
jgi:hypothetical protein